MFDGNTHIWARPSLSETVFRLARTFSVRES
jgi:hypothetical protein